jgi:hypothetical protein
VQGNLTDFTPFGYLRNTAHRARAWADTSGGNLRTSLDRLGVEWAYPVGRDATSHAGIAIETSFEGRLCRTRAEFDAIGLRCGHHTCLIVGYTWQLDRVKVQACFFLVEPNALCLRIAVHNTAAEPRGVSLRIVQDEAGPPPDHHVMVGSTSIEAQFAPDETRQLIAVLARGDSPELAHVRAERALTRAETVNAELLAEDAAFLAACPILSGDWPAHWPEGLHHDFQTTRLLVQPPGGIFADVWPAWMAAWPRVVFAEGTLDMLRLAYAEPALAKRAVASLLRDAPLPNIPCVFRDGEYNMLARDGSRCGTSPAWCLPFLNLELLYLATLDRDWLAEIYPRAAGYLNWWLANRTDAHGWLVYKCTWESGEDGNPRLDPSGSGDADISGRVRPVELQAAVAHAARVLAFFASELGADATPWRRLEADYRQRTAQLYDPAAGRYADWLIAEDRLQLGSCADHPYWGVDPCRYSAQSLTPLLVGLPLAEAEIWRLAAPPWTLWPSWTWSLVESAAAAGRYLGIGQLAFNTIDRVYRMTTRRELGSLRRALPGCSPEFWPEDWRTYAGSDAYGWGATTANLLIRHLFGFKESPQTDGWVAELVPAFPSSMMRAGARFAIRQLNYRGRQFDLTYTVLDDERLRASFELPDSRRDFDVRRGQRLIVRL